jgi:transcriptional regulator with XRE-family HTH domain
MAEALGIDRSYLSEIESGKKEICLRNLDILAQGFNLTIARLTAKI